MRLRRRRASAVILTAIVVIAGTASIASAATVSVRPDYRTGSVRLAAAYSEPCAQVLLEVDGQLRDAVSVATTATSVEMTAVPLTAPRSFVLRGLAASGAESWLETLTLDPSTYRPSRPSLGIASRKVVSSRLAITATNARPVTKVRARGDETRSWVWTTHSRPLRRFRISGVRPARGPSVIVVVAYNGFGRSPTARRLVFWIGSVPTTTRSVVADKRFVGLFHVYRGRVVKWWPVAFGKSGTPTPNGDFKVGAARPASGAWGVLRRRLHRASDGSATMFYIHGTNAPWSIGTFASHGCIRMYNSDVREFARTVPNGTRVRIH